MSEFVEVKTVELEDVALDWAVAQAAGWVAAKLVPVHASSKTYYEVRSPAGPVLRPSSNWAQGGPLIEKYKVMVAYHNAPDRTPLATTAKTHPTFESGDTVLIAACRAIVAHKLGDTVSVPRELMP